ncbi:hypothetical protein LJR090_004222 [Bosea sp. LjRoot90]|uniref:hypothetical protein n=1 Tax=Bosea sp. LjRoot90 TaxID=3342342 RepID=UPI003ECE879D
MSSTFVQTTLDYLTAFKRFSGFDVDYVHVTHHASMGVEFDSYDIVFHSYCSRLCFEGYVSESYRERLRNFSGIKVLAVQDEYDHTDILKAAIKDLKFDIVLTCVPQDSLEYVYPRAEFPDVEFITVFTGYVPEDFASALPPAKPLAERPFFIGYRGRDIGGRYGRLGFDKFEIGRRMKELCDARGIETDIAMDEASRIYGTAWFDFVGNCRAMLGSESGSNVFDFDGRIDARFKEMTAANGGVPPSYADFLPIVADRDGEIEMGQISPRVFECAMMRTPMVLFKGRYSDAIVPDEHYITLEKDFSNLDDVLARLRDLPGLEAMTQRAFDHLVGTGRFTYRTFYGGVAAAAERKLAQKSWTRVETALQVPATALGADGRVLEPATSWPMGAEGFRIRQGVEEALIYRREFDRLITEFAHVRSIFEAEMLRLYNRYMKILGLFGEEPKENGTLLTGWGLSDCAFAGLLISYDQEAAAVPLKRHATFVDFGVALASGTEAEGNEALRLTVEVEKDGYFRMIDWIKRLNEAYNAERLQLESAFQARIDELRTTVLPRLPLQRRLGLMYMLARMRVRRLGAATVRGAVRSAFARRLLAAVPSIEPLARRIAIRLKLSGLT